MTQGLTPRLDAGLVTDGTQTIVGVKTFSGTTAISGALRVGGAVDNTTAGAGVNIVGRTTGVAVPPGYVGEAISVFGSGSVNLTSGTAATAVTYDLPAGNWLVSGLTTLSIPNTQILYAITYGFVNVTDGIYLGQIPPHTFDYGHRGTIYSSDNFSLGISMVPLTISATKTIAIWVTTAFDGTGTVSVNRAKSAIHFVRR